MRKVIVTLLLIIFIFTLTGCGKNSFEYEICENPFHDGTCVSLIKYKGISRKFDIPETIDNKKVCILSYSLFYNAMENNQKIDYIPNHIQLPDFSKYLYEYFDCEIENGVVYYKDRVVDIQANLLGDELIIREGTKTISYDIHPNPIKAKYIYLPGSLKEIDYQLFNDQCWSFERIDFGEGIDKIKAEAFYSCENLKYIKFPSTLKVIETGAFGCSTSNLDVYLPKTINEIQENAFREGTFRIYGKIINSNWDGIWDGSEINPGINVITKHREQYFCPNCKGYTNKDYDGNGHKCKCE